MTRRRRAGAARAPRRRGAPINDLPNPYQTVEDYFKLPAGRTWGSTSAVDIDKDGTSIWVGERCGVQLAAPAMSPLDPILKFDATGKLVKSFGAGMFVFPHGIHVDRDGNIWVDRRPRRARRQGSAPRRRRGTGDQVQSRGKGADDARQGRRRRARRPKRSTNRTTSSRWPNGDILVAEGHSGQNPERGARTRWRASRSSRRTASSSSQFGKLGSGPGEFRTPHSLAFDSRGRLFVADRGNVRIQIFDQNVQVPRPRWKQFSRLSGIYIDKNDMLYGADSESSATIAPGRLEARHARRQREGRQGDVLHPRSARRKRPAPAPPRAWRSTRTGNIYGAEVGPKAVKRYVEEVGTQGLRDRARLGNSGWVWQEVAMVVQRSIDRRQFVAMCQSIVGAVLARAAPKTLWQRRVAERGDAAHERDRHAV